MAHLNLDSRISDTWNRGDGIDPYGKPIRPEGSGRCWYCWAVLGNDPTTKGGREFCGPRHALAYHGRAGLAEIDEEELDVAYGQAIDAVQEAEHAVSEAEANLDEAEYELRAARDTVRALEEEKSKH